MAERVLIVEDDPDTCDVLADALRDEGYRVDVVPDCEQAMAHVDADVPEALVIDVLLPDGRGTQIVDRLRARGSRARVVFITTSRDAPKISQDYGVPVLKKPFDLDQLIEHVRAQSA